MTNSFMFRNKLLICLLILSLCLSMIVPALAYEETTLYNGCSGEEVRVMQQALINLGYLEGKADGKFGNKTEEAVRAFQRKNGLTPDGLAGKKTRSLLESARNSGSVPADETAAQASDFRGKKEADWDAMERKARKILEKEGHSTNGLNYVTCFYAPKEDSKLRYDCYSLSFYKSKKTSVYDWIYSVSFDQNGKLVDMCTKYSGGKKLTHIEHPTDKDVDKKLFDEAKKEIRAFLERRGRSSLTQKVSKLYVSQISFSKDKQETYYTFSGPFMVTVRVAPSIQIDYFVDDK